MGRPVKIAKAQAVITLTATATSGVVTTSANLNNLGVIAGMPFIPAANIGGLVAGRTYWILEVLSATTFSVSETDLSANVDRTRATLTSTSAQSVAATVAPVDLYYNNPVGSSSTYSVVGGNTAIFGNQVLANVCIGVQGEGTISCADDSANLEGVGTDFANTFADGTIVYDADGVILGIIDDIANANATFATFAANASANVSDGAYVFGLPEDGYIVRQKGKQKYLVKGTTTGLVGACFTANVANTALLPNTMSITATYANSDTQLVQSIGGHNAELFTANSGPVATGNIVLEDADPAFVTFNSAEAANAAAGIPYPIVTIDKA